MIKRIISAFLSILMIILLSVNVFATEEPVTDETVSDNTTINETEFKRVIDNVNVLSDQEYEILSQRTESIYNDYGYDICCMLTEGAGDDDMFSNAVYSQILQKTKRSDCVLLILSRDSGEMNICSYGKAVELFTDEVINDIKDDISGFVSSKDWYGAFGKYITACENSIYDMNSEPEPIEAAEEEEEIKPGEKEDVIRVSDYVKKLSAEEREILSKRSKTIYSRYGYDIYFILTENAKDNGSYSFNYYSQIVSLTDRYDVILIIISADTGACIISPYGETADLFSDEVIYEIKEKLNGSISSGDYFGAFGQFISICDKKFEDMDSENSRQEDIPEEEENKETDKERKKSKRNNKDAPKTVIIALLGSAAIGFGVSYLVCFIFKSQMNNTGIKTEARDYMVGGLNLTENSETLIKKKVTKKKLDTVPPGEQIK